MILETSKTQRNTNLCLTTVLGLVSDLLLLQVLKKCGEKKETLHLQRCPFLSATLLLFGKVTVGLSTDDNGT